ncbi:MAG: ACP S-malonyltransferase [Solirubrobacterales bacterium]
MSTSEHTAAILFPGQGVGDPSSRDLVSEVRPDLLALATELVGEDPFVRISEGTRYAQPAVYCASIAGFEQLGRPAGDFFAGHSLGEIGALAAAGAIRDEDGLRIVVARGRTMDEAARAATSGGMLAVGSDPRQARALAESHGLAVANENSPEQFVLSGPLQAVAAAEATAKQNGIRAKRLAVAGAFHTEAMSPAVGPFRAALDAIDFRRTPTRVVSSTTAGFFAADVRERLAASLTSPVRWISVMRKLRRLGATRYLDVGPGKVLAGLVRRTIDDAEVEAIASRESALA